MKKQPTEQQCIDYCNKVIEEQKKEDELEMQEIELFFTKHPFHPKISELLIPEKVKGLRSVKGKVWSIKGFDFIECDLEVIEIGI